MSFSKFISFKKSGIVKTFERDQHIGSDDDNGSDMQIVHAVLDLRLAPNIAIFVNIFFACNYSYLFWPILFCG